MVICLERVADLHTAQLMPLPLSCFSKIQIGFTFLVPAHMGSSRPKAVKRVCVYRRKLNVKCSRTRDEEAAWQASGPDDGWQAAPETRHH